MAKQSPTLYSISKTFVWFAIASIVLTGSLAGIVMTDYNRDWKTWQKKFVELKRKKAEAELKAADAKVDKKKLAELEAAEKKASDAVKANRGAAGKLRKELDSLETDLSKAKDSYQTLKQFQDSRKYFFEEHRLHKDPKAEKYKRMLEGSAPELEKRKLALEELEAARDKKLAELEALSAGEKAAQKEIDQMLDERTRIERRLDSVKPSLVKEALNAPMLDFVAPTLKVQQILLDDLYDDYHFAKVQKVDRCVTCHLGIDQKGFEEAPQPFRTHPKLDLYLGSASPHPIEKFGCTVCHGGNGHSVNFVNSAHTPRDEKQESEWKKKYGWAELPKWEHKMLAAQHVQASCAKCHQGVVEVPQADKLNEGRKLAETFGCLNCHKIEGFENNWKVGPDLERIGGKIDEEWINKWLQDPKRFREHTQMPRVFHLTNTSSPEDIEKNNAAIRAISAYLTKNAVTVPVVKPPVAGDVARGEKLVQSVGCTGCHSAAGVELSHHGPALTGLGSKVSADWLYTWLKDPKKVSPHTRMPSLRLSDQEAADITAYLVSMKNPEFESYKAPAADPKVVDGLVLTHLMGTMRRSEAETEMGKMSAEDRLLFLGKKSIAHQGCYSCHAIKGFEDMKPIGADLSNEGAKDIHQFDFGFVHEIPHTRQAWISQKIRDPRSYDLGKEKEYYDKLRMPQFSFTDAENEALTTFILSLTDEEQPLKMQRRLSLTDEQTEKGRHMVAKLNCAGCHAIDGKPGALREAAEDKGAAPPTLEGEGGKVQEAWLHAFLAHPTTIRPWLEYRMPTFGFSEEELKDLVHYFAATSGETISYQGHPAPKSSPEELAAGKALFDKLQCVKCHQVNASSAAMGTSFLAPDLTLSKERLKPEWVKNWIADPQVLEPGTMMPTFFPDGSTAIEDVLGGDANAQIEAIRDYIYHYETKPSSVNPAAENAVAQAS